MGGGSWGTVLANCLSQNCQEVRVWLRDEEAVRLMNSTRTNSHYLPKMILGERVHAFSSLERFFEGGLHATLWALPARVCREQARKSASFFSGDEILFHATKGIEPGSLKRISQVLLEELPCRRIGVISGPNLAVEIARGEPAATLVASAFQEVCEAGQVLFCQENFRIGQASDVIGVEWAGALKNILAIASGALDALNLGWNARALLVTEGLAEMIRFSTALGAQERTFLGLAGLGDLMATCCSPLSRNYQVGFRLAKQERLETILEDLGQEAEGISTAGSVWEVALRQNIPMPITHWVFCLLEGTLRNDLLRVLLQSPQAGTNRN